MEWIEGPVTLLEIFVDQDCIGNTELADKMGHAHAFMQEYQPIQFKTFVNSKEMRAAFRLEDEAIGRQSGA